MLLAIDIGNSSIAVGVFRIHSETQDAGCSVKPDVCFKLSTDTKRSADEYSIYLHAAFQLHGVDAAAIRAIMLSSVVPTLTDVLRQALGTVTSAPLFRVGPGLKSGVNIRTDAPSELGADIVANAAGALGDYSAPMILIDMGTATSVFAVDVHKTILGGSIAPGLKIGLDALKNATSLLPTSSFTTPGALIGKNTDDAVRVGVIWGHAMMLEGMIDAYSSLLGSDVTVVVTGGLAPTVLPLMKRQVVYEEHLTLKGLFRIYQQNSQRIHREGSR